MADQRTIPVFIASPGDLAEERQTFKHTLKTLNAGFGVGADVEFYALGWEDTLAATGRRSQALINADIEQCEVFVLCLHRRWGQDAPDSPCSSYTEEEFQLALKRFNETGAPEIFIFFKRVDPGQEADPGPQLKKVMDFRLELEATRSIMYRSFNDKVEFGKEVEKHLIAYTKGELPQVPDEPINILPQSVRDELEHAKQEKERALAKAEQANERAAQAHLKAEILQLDLAEEAAEAADSGKLETARQKFARAVDGTTNTRVLFLAFAFYYRTGELRLAESYMYTVLALNGEVNQQQNIASASAYGNLGIINETRGNIDEAELYYHKSLKINKKLGHELGIASDYGNLGIVYKTRGELDKAEQHYHKAIRINQSLNRQEGVAIQYGNLGNVHKEKGEIDKAEEYFKKALSINKTLNRLEGMAVQYGNLAQVYELRGDYNKAEEYCLTSLDIENSLGRQAGMAVQYNNLGNIYNAHNSYAKAKKAWISSLKLFKKMGILPMIREVQESIDRLTGQ